MKKFPALQQASLLGIAFFTLIMLVSCSDKHKKWIEILDPAAASIIDSNTEIRALGKGYQWAEGPVYVPQGGYFLFSDVGGNTVYRWKEGSEVTVYLKPSGYTGLFPGTAQGGSNGLAIDGSGRLILCQDGDRRLAMMDAPLDKPEAKFTVLADKYEDKRFNSPNDVVVAPNGDIFFTDPPYGLKAGVKDSLKELPFQGIYCLKKDGRLVLLTKELGYPNGVTLSPDGKQMFIANSDLENMIWVKYALTDSNTLGEKTIFADIHPFEKVHEGTPDGIKIAKNGTVFASGPDGIWIFNAAGKLLAKVHTGDFTANCALSADDKFLFITANHQVMGVALK